MPLIITILSLISLSVNLVHGLTDRELAIKFAPLLKFDAFASDFPMDAQVYYDYVINGQTDTYLRSYECESSTRCQNLNLADIVTYYYVFRCTNQVRIAYYWWYGYQQPCIDNAIIEEGDHDGDWERIMVTLSLDESKVAAVTYNQHGGWLTRIKARNSFELLNGIKPVVYVGKISHGSYPDTDRQLSVEQCQYFGDFRNPASDGSTQWDTAIELYDISSNSQNWMLDNTFYSGIGTKPQNINHIDYYCNIKACDGTNLDGAIGVDDAGCYQSDCHALVENGDVPTQCFKYCNYEYNCDCDIPIGAYCCKEINTWFGDFCTCANLWNCYFRTESNEWIITHNDDRLL